MPDPDPCLEQVNAVNAILAEIEANYITLDERLAALADCREQNPGLGGGTEGFAALAGKARGKVAKAQGKLDEIKALFDKAK